MKGLKEIRYSVVIGVIIIILAVLFVSGTKKQKSEQIIQTNLYQVSIPNNWTVKETPGYSLLFSQENRELGGIKIVGYYPDQPISHLYPNHSETVYEKELDDFFTKGLQAKLKITPPAAGGEDWVKEQIHIYILFKDENIAYDIWFDSNYIDEKKALTIAKSFELK
jgi:bla regulator protein BlaR1